MIRWLFRRRREQADAHVTAFPADAHVTAFYYARIRARLEDRMAKEEELRKAEASRRLLVQNRIFKHGYMPMGFLPGITTEMLEGFADELDKLAAKKAIDA